MKKEILFQLDLAWQLWEYHCQTLGEEEALWCFGEGGLRVRQGEDGWRPDWPDTEAYSIGPASIAWILWHILFWWKSTIRATRDGVLLNREDIPWPGATALALEEIRSCRDEWLRFVDSLTEEELASTQRCRWPMEGQSLCALLLWLNAELMKNAAEIGSARFLYAAARQGTSAGEASR